MKLNESDFYTAMNKPDALPRVAEVAFYKIMADIRWDPTNWLDRLETIMGIEIADDHIIRCRATFKFQGDKRVYQSTRYISGMTMIASRGPQDLLQACRRETEIVASSVVSGILETFGTTIRDELDRVHCNISEAHKKALLTPAKMLLVHPSKEQQVQEMIAQQKRKDSLLRGGIQVVTSPDIPPDQILVTDGTKDGSALLKNIGRHVQPPVKKNTLKDLLARRKQTAKWK